MSTRPTSPTGNGDPSRSSPLLTPEQAAERLSVPTTWIYRAAREDRLPHVRLGRYVRFVESDLETWIAEQRNGSPAR